MALITLAFAALLAGASPAGAINAGTLDPTWDGDGLTSTSFPGPSGAYAAIVQPDGKYVVAGDSREAPSKFALARYNTDGSLDSTFGVGGRRVTEISGGTDARVFALARDPATGRIAAVGQAEVGPDKRWAVAVYTAEGSPDNNFSGDGQLIQAVGDNGECNGGYFGTGAKGVDFRTDGQIVVGGCARVSTTETQFALARYDSTGAATAGPVLHDVGNAYGQITALDVRADNSIAVAGFATTSTEAFVFARYTDALAAAAPPELIVISTGSRGLGMAQQADGKYVIAGSAGSPVKLALARFGFNGGLDGTFGNGGTQQTTFDQGGIFGSGVGIQPDGRIVAAGVVQGGVGIARYDANGQPDGEWGSGGRVFHAAGAANPVTAIPIGVVPTANRVVVFASPQAAAITSPDAFLGIGLRTFTLPDDSDGDGVADPNDNCPGNSNADQADRDGDGAGDACDNDNDNDGRPDNADNCPGSANPDQADADRDGPGDVCDPDDDNDGAPDASDNCLLTPNADQADFDRDGQGDACDPDDDNDGVLDGPDACDTQPARTPNGCPAAPAVLRMKLFVRNPSLRPNVGIKLGRVTLKPDKGASVKGARVRVLCVRGCKLNKAYSVRSNKSSVTLRALQGRFFRNGSRIQVTLTRARPAARGRRWAITFTKRNYAVSGPKTLAAPTPR